MAFKPLQKPRIQNRCHTCDPVIKLELILASEVQCLRALWAVDNGEGQMLQHGQPWQCILSYIEMGPNGRQLGATIVQKDGRLLPKLNLHHL